MRLSINKKEMPARTGEAVIKSELPELKVKLFYPRLEDYPDHLFDFSEFWNQPCYFIIDEDGFRDHHFNMDIVDMYTYIPVPDLIQAGCKIWFDVNNNDDPLWGINLTVPFVQETLSKISRYYGKPGKYLADHIQDLRFQNTEILKGFSDITKMFNEEDDEDGTSN